jgi:hypothetical protein
LHVYITLYIKDVSTKTIEAYLKNVDELLLSQQTNADWIECKEKLSLPQGTQLLLSSSASDCSKFPSTPGMLFLTPSSLIFRTALVHNYMVLSLKDIKSCKKQRAATDHLPEFAKGLSIVSWTTSAMKNMDVGSTLDITLDIGTYKFSFLTLSDSTMNRWLYSVTELSSAYSEQAKNGSLYNIHLPSLSAANLIRTYSLSDYNKREVSTLLIFSRLDEPYYKDISKQVRV